MRTFSTLQEPIASLANSVQLYSRYITDVDSQPLFAQLFESKEYQRSTEVICGKDRPLAKRYQVHFQLQIPGTDLGVHYDMPYFHSKFASSIFST